MIQIDRFERQLPMALTVLADPRTPDYLVDILGQTARTRQRPAWASLERWLPMDIASTTRPVRGAPWRQLGVLALLAVLLATALAVYVGSRRSEPTNLPAPFGRAVNGLIPYAIDGDLFAGDAVTGGSELLLPGDFYDYDPWYSRDGTQIAFMRRVDPAIEGVDLLMVMNLDDMGVRQIATDPFRLVDWWDWAPDGESIIVSHAPNGINILELFDLDGIEAPRRLAEGISVQAPAFRPPDGGEILFRGQTAEGVRLYVMTADGTDIRPLTEPITGPATYDLLQPRYSPDGSRIAYQAWDPGPGVMRLHIMDADGSNAREVRGDAGTYFLAYPVWSNDGSRIAAHRIRDLPEGGSDSTFVIIDLANGTVTPTGPGLPENGGTVEWAPDDSTLLMVPNEDSARQLLLDPTGEPWTEAPWDSDSYPNWQRKAD